MCVCVGGGGSGAALIKEQIGTESMTRRKNQKCFDFSNKIAPAKMLFFHRNLNHFNVVLHLHNVTKNVSNTSDIAKDYLNSNLRYHRQF